MQFERVHTNAPWESAVGYCRALRAGDHIFVTGTAPLDDQGNIVFPGNAYAQTKRCLEIIDKALAGLGADRSHVVRTRILVTDIDRWQEYGKAHQEHFAEHPPATIMFQVARFIHPDIMVEIEADAVAPRGE